MGNSHFFIKAIAGLPDKQVNLKTSHQKSREAEKRQSERVFFSSREANVNMSFHTCHSLCFGLQESSIKRQLRTLEAANHVGVAIVSSAVTTVISTIPLFFCVIVPFAKFGQIVAINTAISIAFTLTVTTALLATMGPSDFTRPPRAVLKAALVVLIMGVCGGLLWWTGSQFAPDTLI
ncbi:hypothetical protein M9458_018011 [Cirrhinus mrigala]|uniref:Membrane transport protein MMPL domain-containing protein n=1 Tax=Cirrhinus mrigala TaxID=683832 RepID=A0ABD0QJD5_CIRMR